MLTLSNLLLSTSRHYATRTAIHTPSGHLTWAAYADRIARCAGMLASLGLRPGDRFATLCRNTVEHAELLMGGYWAGIVPIPLNFWLTGADIAWMLDNAGCRLLMVDEDLAYLLDQAQLRQWRSRAVSVGGPAPGASIPDTMTLTAQASPVPPHPAREEDTALCLYTGGTTGRGKGVRLSHRNIVANALQLSRVMAPSPSDIYLHVSPMYHSTDLKATVVSMFGGSHVYLKDASPEAVLEAIERFGVTIASLLPSMIERILRETPIERYDLSSLRLISYGTAPLDEACLREAARRFPHAGLQQCYGLTETSPFLAILDEDAHRRAVTDRPELLKAAGRILPGTLLTLLDEAGNEVAPGEVGEIVVRGPQVGQGYIGLPEEEAQVFRGGAFYTGDIGRLDDEGYLYIVDRKREVVAAHGAQVYTRTIEDVLHHCPGIAEAAVVGVPDPACGEELLAVLVSKDAPPSPADIAKFCAARLEPRLVPRRFMFVDGLPRTPLGKIRKQELQEAYQSQLQAGARGRPAWKAR